MPPTAKSVLEEPHAWQPVFDLHGGAHGGFAMQTQRMSSASTVRLNAASIFDATSQFHTVSSGSTTTPEVATQNR
jgi:hypothetical protein